MTAIYTVKEILAHVAAGTLSREAAIAHCDSVLARPNCTDNKRMRWTRVRDAVAKGETITVAAAFATVPAKPAKPAPAKAEPQPKAADPLTAITQRLAAQDQRMDALMAAFTTLLDRMPKPRTKKAA